MKKIISLAILLCLFFASASAQEGAIPPEEFGIYNNVWRYYDGVKNIAKALNSTGEDRAWYFDCAIKALRPNKVQSAGGYEYKVWYTPLKLTAVDVAAELPAESIYTYEYVLNQPEAKSLVVEGAIIRGSGDAPKDRCSVKHLAIKAKSSVCYEDVLEGETAIVVAVAAPNNKIRLTVISDKTHQGTSYSNGMVGFCKWTATKGSKARYRIENLEDRDVSLIIIAN